MKMKIGKTALYVTWCLAFLASCAGRDNVAYKVAFRDNVGLESRVKGDTLVLRSQNAYHLYHLNDGRRLFRFPSSDHTSRGRLAPDGIIRYSFDVMGKWLLWTTPEQSGLAGGELHRLDLDSWQHTVTKTASLGYRVFPSNHHLKEILIADQEALWMLDVTNNHALWSKRLSSFYSNLHATYSQQGIIVAGAGSDSIYVISPTSGETKKCLHFMYATSNGAPPYLLINDSNLLTIGSAVGVQQIDMETGEITWNYSSEGRTSRMFRSANQNILLVMENAGIKLLDWKTGKVVRQTESFSCLKEQLSLATMDPTGQRIALAIHCDSRSGIALLDTESLEEVQFFPCATSSNFEPIIHNGHLIYYLDQEGVLVAWKIRR